VGLVSWVPNRPRRRCRQALKPRLGDRVCPLIGWREVPVDSKRARPTCLSLHAAYRAGISSPERVLTPGKQFRHQVNSLRSPQGRIANARRIGFSTSCSLFRTRFHLLIRFDDARRIWGKFFRGNLSDDAWKPRSACSHQRFSTNTLPVAVGFSRSALSAQAAKSTPLPAPQLGQAPAQQFTNERCPILRASFADRPT